MSKLNEVFSISELKSNLNSSNVEIELLNKKITSKSFEQINLLEKISKLEWNLQSNILYTSVLENELEKFKHSTNNGNLESEMMKEKLRVLKIKFYKKLQELTDEKTLNRELMEKNEFLKLQNNESKINEENKILKLTITEIGLENDLLKAKMAEIEKSLEIGFDKLLDNKLNEELQVVKIENIILKKEIYRLQNDINCKNKENITLNGKLSEVRIPEAPIINIKTGNTNNLIKLLKSKLEN